MHVVATLYLGHNPGHSQTYLSPIEHMNAGVIRCLQCRGDIRPTLIIIVDAIKTCERV